MAIDNKQLIINSEKLQNRPRRIFLMNWRIKKTLQQYCRVLCLVPMALLMLINQPVNAGTEKKKIKNSLDMTFVRIPAGKYRIGPKSEQLTNAKTDAEKKIARRNLAYDTGNPRAGQQIEIKKPFYLGAHEVRGIDYQAFCKATKRPPPTGEWYDLNTLRWIPNYNPLDVKEDIDKALPVTCVSYDDAVAFCEWLSKKEGRKYRLPTEVEWEYAARAGKDEQYYWNSEFDNMKINGHALSRRLYLASPEDPAILLDLSSEEEDGIELDGKPRETRDAMPANAWGLYHMLGNVQEFVTMTGKLPDDEQPFTAFTELPGKTNRMMRGGSWLHDKRDCNLYRALFNCPPYSNCTIGFRVLLEL